jgi:Amt family ammonium transporter
MLLGRRESHRAKEAHEPANVPYVLLGTGLLWFGWFGFNAGSAGAANGLAATAFATTNTASAVAMLAWIFLDWSLGKKPSAMGACIGAVVGLVAITPAAGFVTVRQSILIGLIASVISNIAVHLRTKSSLDDTLDVFPCHGLGGLTGMILTAVFADPGEMGRNALLMAHAKALGITLLLAFVGSLILFKLVDLIIPLRVTPDQEKEGLDFSQHGEAALAISVLNGNGNGNGHTNGNGVSKPGEYVTVGH